jgi:hypothetical protein
METDTVYAAFVDEDDFILVDDEPLRVVDITDVNDVLHFLVVNDEGDKDVISSPPFEHLTIVTSFVENVEFEDVDIDA